jgi:hypothetical protein
MIRVASQLTFCSPEKILRRTVIERDDENLITQLFSLDDSPVESAQTLFFDGIISVEIVSLKQNIPSEKITEIVKDYNYIDISSEVFSTHLLSKMPLILDFGTNSIEEINLKLAKLAIEFSTVPVFDLIAACVYYPTVLIGKEPELKVNKQTNLVLWENVNLPEKRLTSKSRVRKI